MGGCTARWPADFAHAGAALTCRPRAVKQLKPTITAIEQQADAVVQTDPESERHTYSMSLRCV